MMVPSVENLISTEEERLVEVTRRLFALEAIHRDLERVTRGKQFSVCDAVMWTMVLDFRDMFVVQFASWAKGMYAKGGFLRSLQAHGLRQLRRKWKAGAATPPDRWIREYLADGHQGAFSRLFPEVMTPFPTPEDLDRLVDAFSLSFGPLVTDRDSNRAHPHEGGESARMLDFTELRAMVRQAEQLLTDLRVVTCRSSSSFRDMNATSVEDFARTVVDAILLDPLTRASGKPELANRDAHYAEMHRRHDDAGGSGYFNDRLLAVQG